MIIVMDKGYAQRPGESAPVRSGAVQPTAALLGGPQPAAAPPKGPAPGQSATPSAFEQVVVNDLIPAIDRHYRTLTGRESRAMAGLSMGGGQTFEIVLRNPNLFAYVGGFSGVPGGNGGPTIDPKTAFGGVLADAAPFNKRMKLMWIGTGTMEPERMMQGMKGFREAITKAGIKHVFYESQGTAHEWLTWRRDLHEFAPQLFR
jgi:enterochelin esterase family protein